MLNDHSLKQLSQVSSSLLLETPNAFHISIQYNLIAKQIITILKKDLNTFHLLTSFNI